MTRKLTCFTCQFRDKQRTGAEICPANVSGIDTPWGRACQPLAIFFPVPKNRPRSLCESLLCPVSFSFQNRGIGDLYILRRVLQRVRDLAYSFFAYSQNIGSPESFICHFSLEKLALLPLVKEVTPSPDRKMIKLVTFDILFPSLRHSR